jgi:hypothetical protein
VLATSLAATPNLQELQSSHGCLSQLDFVVGIYLPYLTIRH